MALNEKSTGWQVKVTSLPDTITVAQLAQKLCLDVSRINLPKKQQFPTYVAWLRGFVREEDANEFARQWSGLTISGLTIKCAAVAPIDIKTGPLRQQSPPSATDNPADWQVKVTSLPATITTPQLAQKLCLDVSRINLPTNQRFNTYVVWIDGFVSKEDANEFARRWSGLVISGETIICTAVAPRSENRGPHPYEPSPSPKKNPADWQVKVTSLPATITASQLAQKLCLDISRINIPINQRFSTYVAWIDGFVSEEDANDFALQWSGLVIYGLTITCTAVAPDEGSASSRNPPDETDKRAPCPFANKGICKYTDDGCKYRHTRCQKYDSCSLFGCPLAHAKRSSPEPPSTPLMSDLPRPGSPTISTKSSNQSRNTNPNAKPCRFGIKCFNADCRFEHPKEWHAPNKEILKRFSISEKQTVETIELSDAKNNFLEYFGNKILDAIREESGIKDANGKDGKLQLSGTTSAIASVKFNLEQALHEQNVTITYKLKNYLESTCKGYFLNKLLQKYRVGIAFENDQDRGVDECEDEMDDEFDDGKSDISNTAIFKLKTVSDNNRRNYPKKRIRVLLCSDSEDTLSKAIAELQSYTLYVESLALTQDQIAFILKQQQRGKALQSNLTVRDRSIEIKKYFIGLVQSTQSGMVQIFILYKNGVWHVKVTGFRHEVDCAVPKIKGYLDDVIETEAQIPISRAMAFFFRTKALSDIRKLEKNHHIKITIFSPPRGKRMNDNNDEQDDDYHCLKLSGSTSHINLAKDKVESFLDSLTEREKNFPCETWDIARVVSTSILTRLKKLQESQDCEAIGLIKFYTAIERRETTPNVPVTVVSLNEETADDVIQQCTDISEGYIVWKLSRDEFRAIFNGLIGKKSPSIEEFRQQWDTHILLDRDTNTITIPAGSKMIADEVKDALHNIGLGIGAEKKRISEFIPIQLNTRRFVMKAISTLLDEAKAQKIFVEFGNRNGLTLCGRSDIVTVFKEKINTTINDIKQKIIIHRLQLSVPESDLIQAKSYEIARRIERETNTIVRDVKADMNSSTSTANDGDISSTITSVVNSRGQTIVVEKGDITKVNNVDAIVNAANGQLYHASGVDKAIADAAGPALDQECKQLIAKNGGLPISTGKSVKTTAGNLPFKCVIHAIGPQHSNGNQGERPLLFSSILSSLRLAESEGCKSVALPAISSNTYGFPLADCTNIVIRAVKQFFADYPQSIVRKVILIDIDDASCNSFAREVVIDHTDTAVDNNDDIMNYELPPLTAKWCWQDNTDEKIYDENHTRQIEAAFQQYLQTSIVPKLIVSPDNLTSGTIINYSIHFLPVLKQLLINNPNTLNGRFICGHQKREDTGYKRNIIRYPVVQQSQPKSDNYRAKPLDSYNLQVETTQDDWDIFGITNAAVQQARQAIRTAINSATVSEHFSVNLNKDLDIHKEEIVRIATQQLIKIDFPHEDSGQLQMVLRGLKPNVSEAKLKIALYAQDILKMQVDKDDELKIPKEWGDQKEGWKLVEILRNHPEFTRIENRMKETLNHVKIDKIERVQNVRLWSYYAFRRRQLKQELIHLSSLQIEMELFHGTRDAKPSEIYDGEFGFDMTYSTSGMWGIGTYFAANASYSCDSYAYKLPDEKRQVFLAQVLTGDVYDCKSDPTLRRCPKKNEAVSNARYNSVSGDTGGSKVYIVYENRVAYPTYLITFSR